MQSVKDKHRELMTLLGRAGIDEETRHKLVFAWTEGRTESTRDLYENEIIDLIWKIKNDWSFSSNMKRSANVMMELAIKKKRSTVLAIAQRVGIHEGTDFKKFNGFMEKRSILKKKLSKYTFDELDQLIQQMHNIESNFKKSAEKAFNKAWHEHYRIPETSKN